MLVLRILFFHNCLYKHKYSEKLLLLVDTSTEFQYPCREREIMSTLFIRISLLTQGYSQFTDDTKPINVTSCVVLCWIFIMGIYYILGISSVGSVTHLPQII